VRGLAAAGNVVTVRTAPSPEILPRSTLIRVAPEVHRTPLASEEAREIAIPEEIQQRADTCPDTPMR